jgi:putative Mn2+ efflux pump MntP
MDAFSVSLVTGFGLGGINFSDSLKISLTFGIAHVLMPILGWYFGSMVNTMIQRWDHWVAFVLLVFIGSRLMKEGLDKDSEEFNSNVLAGFPSLFLFTLAVSMDALAVGLSFRLEQLRIWLPSLYMGVSTLIFTFIGLSIGNRIGLSFGKKAQIIGGIILILIGLRIFLSHIS